MAAANVDQVAAIKASLEMMVSENTEIHEYFRDLLGKVSELEEEPPEARREKFKDLVSMGAFRFNGLDIRHFTHTQRKPLPPPLFFSRTQRRLRNTLTMVDEFERRGLFPEGEQLREELDMLSSTIVNKNSGPEVKGFKEQVDQLRESSLFQSYLEAKNRFIRQDAELRTDAEFMAAKESLEDGEELYRQRAEDLDALSRDLDSGDLALEDAQARLDAMSLDAETPDASDEASDGDAALPDVEAGGEFDALSGAAEGSSADELDNLLDEGANTEDEPTV